MLKPGAEMSFRIRLSEFGRGPFLAEKNWRNGPGLSRIAGGRLVLGGLLVFTSQRFL